MKKLLYFFLLSFVTIFLMDASNSVVAAESSEHIYLEKRDAKFKDNKEWLTIKQTEAGLRIVTVDGEKELVMVDNFGGIYLNGDVYLNDQNLNKAIQSTVTKEYIQTWIIVFFVALLSICFILIFVVLKMKRNIARLNYRLLEQDIKGEL